MSICQLATQNANILQQQQNIKHISYVMKVNTRVADSVGSPYFVYLQEIFPNILEIYQYFSTQISNAVQTPGCLPDHIVKPMKSCRRDCLVLIQTYLNKETNFQNFA
jgi:exportin-1